MRWHIFVLAVAWLLVPQLPAAELLTPRGGTWKYFDQGPAPADWKSASFDDGSWPEGPAPLGYGDNDESTVVGYGPNSNARHITNYFRKRIDVPAGVENEMKVTLELQRDDGAVVYLDGIEIARSNMPEGPIHFSTLAASTVSDAAEDAYFPIALAPAHFTEGSHVLAVEVHQIGATSSDLSFDLAITYGLDHPGAVDYTPEFVELDAYGVVWLYEGAGGQVHRWSVPLRRFLESIPITPGPTRFAYSRFPHALYTGYPDGTIRVTRLGVPAPVEEVFANVGSEPDVMLGTSNALLVANEQVYRFLEANGSLLASRSGSPLGHALWDPIGSRLVYFPKSSQNIPKSNVLLPDFTLQAQQAVAAERPPLRAGGDGSIVSGHGHILSPTTPFTSGGSLADTALDMAWSGNDTIFTLRQGSSTTESELRIWSGAKWTETRRLPVSGAPLRVFAHAGSAVLVTQQNGRPRVRVFDGNLDELAISETLPDDAGSLKISTRAHTSLTVSWNGGFPQAENFLVQYRAEGATLWNSAPLLPGEARGAILTGLQPLTLYQLRFRALNALGGGEFSQTSTARTLATAQTPMGSPYSIDAIRVTHNEIQLEWNDNAANESGFRLYRSLQPILPPGPHATLPANQTGYTDTSLQPSTLYYYWVEAFNGATGGEISSPDSATTAAAAGPPLPRSARVFANADDPTRIRLSWDDWWTNEDGFILQRRPRFGGGPFSEIARTGISETVFDDETAEPLVTYEYVVTVFNAEGSFDFTNGATVVVPAVGGTYLHREAKVEGIHYFAFRNPSRIERFNLQTSQWLTPIPTADEVTALAAGTETLYVGEGRKLSRMNPDGSFFHLTNRPWSFQDRDVFEIAGNVILRLGRDYVSHDALTGSPVETFSITQEATQFQSTPGSLSIYINDSGSSLVTALRFLPDGTFDRTESLGASAVFNDFFLSPDGSALIAEDSGSVYALPGGQVVGSLGSGFDDMDLTPTGTSFLSRGEELFAFDSELRPIGVRNIGRHLRVVSTAGDSVTVFNEDGKSPRGITAETLSVAEFSFPAPGPPLSSRDLSPVLSPADVLVDNNGIVYLHVTTQSASYRWSPSERRYLESIPLIGNPATVTYLPDHHRLYVAYPSGIVSMIDLASGTTETPLFAASSTALIAAGSHLYSGGWIYDLNGVLTDTVDGAAPITSGTWISSLRRVLGVGSSGSAWNNLSPSGTVTATGTPEGVSLSNAARKADGTLVLAGANSILSTSTFNQVGAIGLPRTKAAWSGSSVYTIRENSSTHHHVLRWDSASGYKLGAFGNALGTPLGLFDVPEGILLVSLLDHVPRFTILHRTTLATLYSSEDAPPSPGNPVILARESEGVLVGVSPVIAHPAIIEYRLSSSDPWLFGVEIPPGATSVLIPGLSPGASYRFRIRSHGEVYDATSLETLSSTTLSPTDAGGEPYGLRMEAATTSVLSLRWDDTTTTETGFHVLRSTDASAQTGSYAIVQSVGGGVTQFTDSGFPAGTTVHYRVQAFNAGGAGDLSGPLTLETLVSDTAPPRAPNDWRAIDHQQTSFRITWADRSGNEDGFIVRLANDGGSFTEIGRVGSNVTSFHIENLSPDKRYFLEISAFNQHGESSHTAGPVTLGSAMGGFAGLTCQGNGLLYASASQPYRIERYDLNARQWLQPWLLPGAPSAMAALGSDLYFGMGTLMFRIAGNGAVSHLANVTALIDEIYPLDNALLYRNAGGSVFYRMQRSNGADLGSFDPTTFASIRPLALSPDRRYLYGSLASADTLIRLEVSTSGQLLSQSYPPVEASIARSSPCHMMSGGTAIAFETGSVLSIADFSYQGTLTQFTDIAFAGATPILIHANEVIASRPSPFAENGVFLSPAHARSIVVNGSDIIAFLSNGYGNHGLLPIVIPLADLPPRSSVAPIAPEGYGYPLDDAFVDDSGIVWMFSDGHAQLFRWNMQTRDWIETIPLPRFPAAVAHWPSQGKVAVIDERGVIRTHAIGGGAPGPGVPFAKAQSRGLAAMGNRLAALGSLNTSYDANGNLLHTISASGNRHTWDAVHQRLLYMESNTTIASLPVDAAGRFGPKMTAPVPAVSSASSIRLRPDGQRLFLTNTSQILDPVTLRPVTSLNRSFRDVTWIGTSMFSIESPAGSHTRVVSHGPAGEELADLYLPGSPFRIMARGTELVVLTRFSGVPRLFVLSLALVPLADSSPNDLPGVSVQPLQRVAEIGSSVTFEVRAVGAFPLSYLWYRGTAALSGETGRTLTLTEVDATDGGEYSVCISNPNGNTFSNSANLSIGARLEKFVEAGNLLVRRATTISEITLDGMVRQIPPPIFNTSGSPSGIADLAVDRFGRLHAYSIGSGNSGSLATYHGNGSAWMYFGDAISPSTSAADRDLSIIGDEIVTRASRFGLLDWANTPVTTDVPGGVSEISGGLDGKVYALGLATPRTQVFVLDPVTFAIMATVPITATNSTNPQALAVATDGSIYLARRNGVIERLAANGTSLASLATTLTEFTDIGISGDGRIAAGTTSGTVILTNLALTDFTTLDAPGTAPSYTAWVPSPTRLTTDTAPVFDPTSGLFRQQITITNDGDVALGALEIRLSGLPSGVRLYNGSSGTRILFGQSLLPGASTQILIEYLATSGASHPPFTPAVQVLPDVPPDIPATGIFAVRELRITASGLAEISFPSESGSRYQVESSSTGGTWTALGPALRAAGSSGYWIDALPVASQVSPLLLRVRHLGE